MKEIGKNSGGFTLIELLMAMAVSSIVFVLIYTAHAAQQKSQVRQQMKADMQQSLRAAIYMMNREMRMAGYDPHGNSGAEILEATSTVFKFTLVADDDTKDNDDDGVKDETGELKTITYDLYDAYGDGDNDIGRAVGGSKKALAEDIQALEFYYTLDDDSQVASPTAAQLPRIRTVDISVLARTAYPVKGYTDSFQYQSASGATWGAYNDHYLRHMLVARVNLRNMGIGN